MYPTCAAYPTELADSLSFDLEKCKMILQNFGLKDADGDGRFDSMSGAGELTFTMILCSDSSAKAGMARKFAQDMNSIGITVKIYELSWDDYLKALEDGEIEVGDNRTVKTRARTIPATRPISTTISPRPTRAAPPPTTPSATI